MSKDNDEICLKYDNYVGYPNEKKKQYLISTMQNCLKNRLQINISIIKQYNVLCWGTKIEEFYETKINNAPDMKEQRDALIYGKTLQYIKSHNNSDNSSLIETITKLMKDQ